MLRNYWRIAWRNLVKGKLFSFINIFGLALGMACSLLIGLWVNHERSFNQFLPDADQIYVVHYNLVRDSEVITNLTTPGPLQEVIQKDIPQVKAVTKVADWPNLLVKIGGKKSPEKVGKEVGYYATGDFFKVFQLPAVAGNPTLALGNPNQIVITRRMAEKYFSHQAVLGQRLQLDNKKWYTVGAIIENLPTTSTLRFDWVVNFKVFEKEWMTVWGDNPFQTYVRLNPMTTPTQAERAMKGIYARYTDWKSAKQGHLYPILQPIKEVYLYENYQNGKPAGGRIQYVRIFLIIAGFILMIACINFMNLSTARSTNRAKEVGIRKVIGALRIALIYQFLSESFLTCLLSFGVALSLLWLSLPWFNAVFNTSLVLTVNDASFWLLSGGLILLTGLVAGSYPALFLSSLQPIKILKGRLKMGAGPVLFRHLLVVCQFTLSTALIIGMLVLGQQMRYLQTKNLGMDRENVIAIPLQGDLLQPGSSELFRQQVLQLPTIRSAATVNHLPTNIQGGSGDLSWPGKDPTQKVDVSAAFVGPDFAKTMAIRVLAGRDFKRDSPADSGGYIINESAAKLMGMKQPIGQEINFLRGKGPIIGVVQDFHLQSLHQPITPLVLTFDNGNASYLLVKLRAGQTQQVLKDLDHLVSQINPAYPFEYQFLDEAYGRLYQSEQQVTLLTDSFGIIAILIACLGLFGLAAFTAEQRTKEIGVRKVLGASITSIVSMLSKDFIKPVLLATFLACPVAWYFMDQWLSSFAYRIPIQWWLFTVSGMLAVSIALLTVGFQSIKAALMNPVKSLRSE